MANINLNSSVQTSNSPVQTFVAETDSVSQTKSKHVDVDLPDSLGKAAGTGEADLPTPVATPKEVRQNLKRVVDDLPLDLSAILIAVRKNAQEIRKANVLVRDMGFQAQFDELTKSAGDMKTAADFRLYAGLVQSGVQMLMASAQGYSSWQAGKVAAEGMNPQKEGKALQQDAMDLNAQATQLESQAQAARTAPPASANDTAIAVEQVATSIENEVVAQDKPLLEDDREMVHHADAEQNVDSKESPGLTKGAEVMSLEDFPDEPKKTAPATGPQVPPGTPEKLELEAKGLRSAAKDLKAQAEVKFEQVKDINARADAISSKWDAGSKILDGLFGQPLIAGMKFKAEKYDTLSKRHEVKAKQHESESARANDAIQSAKEIAQDALQKMESIEQARHETNRAIQRNMG